MKQIKISADQTAEDSSQQDIDKRTVSQIQKIAEDTILPVNRIIDLPDPKISKISYLNLLLYGGLITLAFYYFCLFGFRKKTISALYFGIFCILTALLYLLSVEKSSLFTLPIIDLNFLTRIKFICLYCLVTTFIMLITDLYPNNFSSKLLSVFQGINGLFIVSAIIINNNLHSYVIKIYGVLFAFFCIYLFFNLIQASLKKNKEAILLLAGHIFLFVTIINFILCSRKGIALDFWVPLGVFLYIFVISVILSSRYSKSFYRMDVYERFVPAKFLKILRINDIIDIKLGNNAHKDMSILFSNIRNFTSLSGTMTPEENFKFLNAYLKLMGSIIRQNNGFIDKYIGDTIVALFEKSDDAVHAATGMLQKLSEYNEGRKKTGYDPVKIGIGINTGMLRIKTIEEHDRMAGTVISDAVNLASRIEGMTKTYGVPLLISDETYNCLMEPEKFELRKIDCIKVKGKNRPVTVWEVFNCDPKNILKIKKDIEAIFQEARNLYQAKQFDEANELFLNCLANNPKDKTAQLYSDRCKLFMTLASDENMEGRVAVYERFVPKKFLKILGINDIIDIKLGDNAQKDMSILFSDIRDFTSLSETMTPEENFKFLNSYLKVMGPIIRQNNGYIDKYIGDAIMALFEKSDDAVHAATRMLQKLAEYNKGRKRAGYAPIKIGIGINTGTLRIGTIGEHDRMEGTVIGDAVNIASRIEGMTKIYGVSLLISDETYNRLREPENFELRKIDRIKAKGKTRPVTIWEVFDCDPPNIVKIKNDIETIFQEARKLYQTKQFEEANELFLNCLAKNPKDKTARLYSDRCKLFMTMASDENMEGIVRQVSYVTISHDDNL